MKMADEPIIILITGANSGIGLAASKVLVRSAKYHVIMASRSKQKGQAAMEEVQKDDPRGDVSALELDVTDKTSIAAAVKHVEEHFGRLDVLINNAGIYIQGSDLQTELEDTIRTNLVAPALVSQAFKPLMTKSRRPYLLYIGSTLGSLATAEDGSRPDHDLYALGYRVSKAGLNMLAVKEAQELGKQGIKVFSVCPGLVISNLRGTSDVARTSGGHARDPEESGLLILSIVQGERDADVGKFVYKDGVRPW